MQHVVIDQGDDIEQRNQANGVRAENEDEERQDQRSPRVDPFAADVRLHDLVAHVQDDRLESAHEPRRHTADPSSDIA